jgi:bifunctional UDP-N-acetylglucosamine pyrophosphorylase/glucosamine-1-phosphate N-acetyltransferase
MARAKTAAAHPSGEAIRLGFQAKRLAIELGLKLTQPDPLRTLFRELIAQEGYAAARERVVDALSRPRAQALARQRLCQRLMLTGVTIVDPATTYIEDGVSVGVETVIHPNTVISGPTRIGKACQIGPNSIVSDSTIGDRCRVVASVVEETVLESDVGVGPFSHLRSGTYLASGVYVGNFAEVKKSRLERGAKMGHFGYVGDAQVGDEANIGAGTVTCNFDGVSKHRTIVGHGALIGSDTMLVAPVRVGDGASTGAGSVVNRDVPPGTVVAGVPARIRRKQRSRPKGRLARERGK